MAMNRYELLDSPSRRQALVGRGSGRGGAGLLGLGTTNQARRADPPAPPTQPLPRARRNHKIGQDPPAGVIIGGDEVSGTMAGNKKDDGGRTVFRGPIVGNNEDNGEHPVEGVIDLTGDDEIVDLTDETVADGHCVLCKHEIGDSKMYLSSGCRAPVCSKCAAETGAIMFCPQHTNRGGQFLYTLYGHKECPVCFEPITTLYACGHDTCAGCSNKLEGTWRPDDGPRRCHNGCEGRVWVSGRGSFPVTEVILTDLSHC